MSDFSTLQGSSVRTLAWLGDAEYERDVRLRLAKTGDWPTDVLDRLRTRFSSATFQAELLTAIETELDEAESALARRGRNANVRSNGRVSRDVKTYRQATAFETVVAKWLLGTLQDQARYTALVVPYLQTAIDRAVEELRRTQKP